MLLPPGQPLSEPRSRDCHVCGKTMMHYKSLKGHLLRHAKDEETANSVSLPVSNTCHICGKTMMHYKSLKAHIMRHEKNTTSTCVPLEENVSTNNPK
jgi:ssDNA-binding Zn-finger/Zn-ribbon topoisomerase 1